MIRVLHSVSNMDRAGIETFIMNYYRYIDRDVVQFDFLANKPDIGAYEPEIAELGGRVYRAQGFNPAKFRKYVDFLRRTLTNDPDIKLLHVHNGALGLYALAAGARCRMTHRIYHAHSTRVPHGRGYLFKRVLKPFIKYCATDKWACGEESARFYYGSRAVDRGQCVMVHNAIMPEKFRFDPDARQRIRREYGLGDGVVIGHVGRFTDVKNHARMLAILKEVKKTIPNAKMVFVGVGENESAIRKAASAPEFGGDVFFAGAVGNANEWYQAMDAFLMPSLFEGLPVVGVEAQAAGLPCFFSDVVTREVAVTDLCAFIPLSTPDSVWAEKIRAAVTDGKQRRDMRADIRAAGYDVTVEARKLQALYERLASEGGERA